MRRLALLSLFTSILLYPSISLAQTKNVKHHIDFFQVGKTSSSSLAGIIMGYHFTTLEMKRLNMFGFGIAWMGVNSTDFISSHQDIALTTPILTIRLSKPSHGNKVPSPTYFFNVNYGYGLIHKEHGIFAGISYGT